MKLISDKIIRDITDSLGLKYLPENERDEILTRTLEIISKRAGLVIIEGFSDETARKFNAIPKEDLEQMENFMINNNPDAENIFFREVEKVKNEILSAKIEKER